MFGQNMGASLPTLECGQAILGHYRAGNELVILRARAWRCCPPTWERWRTGDTCASWVRFGRA